MKRIRKLIFPVILVLAAIALLWYYWVRPAGSLAAAWNTLLNPPAVSSTALTASGTVEMTEINVAPEAAGKILAVDVKEGDTVHVGDVLVQLDDTLLKDQRAIAATTLQTTNIALAQLTSPSTIASVQAAIAQDKQNIDNAQQAYDNQRTFTTNQSAVLNAQASQVLAQKALTDAQNSYNNVSGSPDNNTDKAAAYQKLYAAQTAYNTANYNYNLWLGNVDSEQLNIKAGALAVAQAKLPEDQALLDVLNGGSIPDNATGAGIVQHIQQSLVLRQLGLGHAQGTRFNVELFRIDFSEP